MVSEALLIRGLPALRLQSMGPHQGFYKDTENPSQILILVKQTLYALDHLLIPLSKEMLMSRNKDVSI